MATEERPYGKLYRDMCIDKRITDADRTIYAFIKSYVNWRVVQSFVAKELGISLSTVKRSINRLDAAGYLDYAIRETEHKRERRSMLMKDEPSTWFKNEPSKNEPCTDTQVKSEPLVAPEEPSVGQICTIGGSNMNHTWVKNEPSGRSNLNHYEDRDEDSLYKASPTVDAEPPAQEPSAQPRSLAELAKDDTPESTVAYKEMLARSFKIVKRDPADADVPVKPRAGLFTAASLAARRVG